MTKNEIQWKKCKQNCNDEEEHPHELDSSMEFLPYNGWDCIDCAPTRLQQWKNA